MHLEPVLWVKCSAALGDSVQSREPEVSKSEGNTVSLSCSYDTSSSNVYLYWYRQYPHQAPQYILWSGAKSYRDLSDTYRQGLFACCGKSIGVQCYLLAGYMNTFYHWKSFHACMDQAQRRGIVLLQVLQVKVFSYWFLNVMIPDGPSAMYTGQTGQSLCKRINGHKSDIRNHNIQKPVVEHFNLSGHSMTDLHVAILQQKSFKNRLQRETAELELIC
uniref:Ig-like domain-containing protein n=1 Tax=Terrapene triunguis TaxID=2587831 RepID=A0A674J230_9SAUR